MSCGMQVTFVTDAKKITFVSKGDMDQDAADFDEIISCISETLVVVFPEITG